MCHNLLYLLSTELDFAFSGGDHYFQSACRCAYPLGASRGRFVTIVGPEPDAAKVSYASVFFKFATRCAPTPVHSTSPSSVISVQSCGAALAAFVFLCARVSASVTPSISFRCGDFCVCVIKTLFQCTRSCSECSLNRQWQVKDSNSQGDSGGFTIAVFSLVHHPFLHSVDAR
jgi:hypothetical protein